jgi:hypothetical protein
VALAGAWAAGEGLPVVLTPAGAGKLIVSLAFQSRWLRCRLVRTAGGGAADWYIFYTMRLYK